MNDLNRKLKKIKRINIDIKKLIVSLVVAYITWNIYNYVEDWKFTIAFIMGGVDVYIINYFSETES